MKKDENRNWITNLENKIDKSILKDLSEDKKFEDFDLEIFYDSINELHKYKKFDADKSWRNISSQINNRKKYSFLKYAASIVILLSFGLSYYLLASKQNFHNSNEIAKHIVLDDGSDIILKKDASLTISKDFNGKTRQVELSGDAYFNVFKNVKKPFIIKTKKAEVKVLGTVFFIDQEPDLFQLELTSGKVSINTDNNEHIEVNPGQKAIINENISLKKLIKNSFENNIDDLFLDNITLNEAIQKINKIYNKEIIAPVDSKLGSETIRMTVKESSVREFLNGLKLIFNVDIQYSKGQYFIKSLKK
ncbi:MAG TPA: hypothetical protein ENK91_13245 [Bacteroidetes bacterium]|nr:hypothetical protein [Bacteroidota bacterium]